MGFLDKFKIRPKDAPMPELVEQRKAAEGVRDEARLVVERAREAFDESGSEAHQKGLAKALGELERAQLHYDRAVRLEQAAREREAVAERARLIAEYEDRSSALSPSALLAAEAPLVDREAELLMELARVRLQRARLWAEKRAEAAALESIHVRLHGPRAQGVQVGPDGKSFVATRAPDYSFHLLSADPVVERMEQLRSPKDPPELTPWIRGLTPTRDTYRKDGS